MSLVSIVIPFYNAADYLQVCLESIALQTYPHIETILIDDGSTDASSKMALQFCRSQGYSLLKRTENKGPGNARNVGMALAKGDYVIFVDSDDHMEPVMVEKMVLALERTSADIVLCKFQLYDEHQIEIYDKVWGFEKDIISGLAAIEGMYSGKIPVTVWGKIFRRRGIIKTVFPTGMIYEDRLFMLKVFFNAKSVHFINEVLLHIQKRETSLTRSPITAKKIEDLTEIYRQEQAFVERMNLNGIQPLLRKYHLSWLRTSFFMLQKQEKQIPSSKVIRATFMEHIKLFYASAYPKLHVKGKILLLLLRLPGLVGWGITRYIMKLLHPNKVL